MELELSQLVHGVWLLRKLVRNGPEIEFLSLVLALFLPELNYLILFLLFFFFKKKKKGCSKNHGPKVIWFSIILFLLFNFLWTMHCLRRHFSDSIWEILMEFTYGGSWKISWIFLNGRDLIEFTALEEKFACYNLNNIS